MAGTGHAHLRDDDDVVLRITDLVVEFPVGGGRTVYAVSGISLDIKRGETLGLVGESGSGKSTTGRAIMQLPRPSSGSVSFEGTELTELSEEQMRKMRPRIQMVFQDPVSSLNPRRKVRDIVGEPLKIWSDRNADPDSKIAEVLEAVGLDVERIGDRRPHQFSGGQCQRISIARSLVLEPEVLICDEPVSALDVSVQAQILNLLKDAKERYGLTMVFIAHDLGVVKNISNRVAVVYLGKLCEVGAADDVYASPAHPYTAALLDSVPVPDPDVRPTKREITATDIPSPMSPPSGCRFRTRCPRAAARCVSEEPQMRAVGPDQFVACHFPLVATSDTTE